MAKTTTIFRASENEFQPQYRQHVCDQTCNVIPNTQPLRVPKRNYQSNYQHTKSYRVVSNSESTKQFRVSSKIQKHLDPNQIQIVLKLQGPARRNVVEVLGN